MNSKHLLFLSLFGTLFWGCNNQKPNTIEVSSVASTILSEEIKNTSLVVLGTIQDAGYPQIACTKLCCKDEWRNISKSQKMITALGLIEASTKRTWLFEATPDFKHQIEQLSSYAGNESIVMPEGIFLTHAHMGHYTGLMQLGREALNAKEVPVYAMPKMQNYLQTNGPWSQLVTLNNISLNGIKEDSLISVSKEVKVTPFLVPHRGEYTETVGFQISGPNKKALFIPDIDKWHLWEKSITEEIRKVDIAFLDATFFKNGEVGNRDMSEIPHPFVEESMLVFDTLPKEEKAKIFFIHFNHTNPMFQKGSSAQLEVLNKGYHIAEEGFVFEL